MEKILNGLPQIFQARILEGVARGSSKPRDQTHTLCVSCAGGQMLHHRATWGAHLPQIV